MTIRVRCINNDLWPVFLTVGEIYEVEEANILEEDEDIYYVFRDEIDGGPVYFMAERFEIVYDQDC